MYQLWYCYLSNYRTIRCVNAATACGNLLEDWLESFDVLLQKQDTKKRAISQSLRNIKQKEVTKLQFYNFIKSSTCYSFCALLKLISL